jgi:hypothetical protein
MWFQMTIEMFSEWTDVARLGSVYDEWNSLGDCLREYSHALEQMGCRYIEQMLDHCNKGEYPVIRKIVAFQIAYRNKGRY